LAAVRDGIATEDQIAKLKLISRGCWGIADISRVTQACHEIKTMMEERGIPITLKSVFTYIGYPAMTYTVQLMLDNVQTIRTAYPVLASTPSVPSPFAIPPSYEAANDIERVLLDVGTLLESESMIYKYSGTFYAGEGSI
jgi:hypothetical protein